MINKKIYLALTILFFVPSKMSIADINSFEKTPLLVSQLASQTPTVRISYPTDPIPDPTVWEKYFIEILTLSLSKVKVPYILEAVSLESRSQTRAERLLEQNIVNIHWIHTSMQKEQALLPIRIPLFKGLIGWRIFFVHKSKIDLFNNIKSLEQLKELNVLQGIDWPDTTILVNNGFTVRTSRNVDNLLRMLQHGRGDYFPRSITEIWSELNSSPNSQLVVEKSLVLRYPTAFYFFVSKNRPEVKELVEKGMNLAISDGSFDKLFMNYFGETIKRSNLQGRKVLFIENPSLPKETPLSRPELWYSISKD